MKKICVLLFLILFVSCMDYIDKRELLVNNKSTSSIYSIISPNDSLNASDFYIEYRKDEKNYPDSKANNINSFVFEEINSREKIENHDRPRDWKSFFEKCKNNQLRLFIISKDSVEKYGWRKIFAKEIFNKKYIFSLNDLEKRNWEVIYR